MKAEDWELIRHFHAGEAWGDWTKMNRDEVVLIDYIRGEMGYPFVLHCAYESAGHDPKGEHPKGNAVDGHFTIIPFKEAVQRLLSILKTKTVGDVRIAYKLPDFMVGHSDATPLDGVVGRGLYPHWIPGTKGFHLDCRGYKSTWGDIGYGRNHQYVSWDEAYRSIR